MSQIQISQELMDAIDMCLKDPEIIDRSFFPEFSQAWNAIFERARQSKASYFDIASDSCYTVHCDFMELSFDFHFDQLKMAEWYEKELKNRKKVVFSGKKLYSLCSKSQTKRITFLHLPAIRNKALLHCRQHFGEGRQLICKIIRKVSIAGIQRSHNQI